MLEALHDLRRAWPQLLLVDLVSRAVRWIVTAPALGLLLWVALSRTDDRVLTDADIAAFALRPLGLLALLALGTLTLAILVARLSVHMVVGFGVAEDRRVAYLDAYAYVGRRLRPLLEACARIVPRLALAAAPFLAALGLVYLLLLGDHDINYYLSQRPPEFRQALGLAAGVLSLLALLLLYLLSGWVLVTPLVLFGGVGGAEALEESRRLTRGRRAPILRALAAWLVTVSLLATAASYLVGLVGGLLVPDLSGNLVVLGATLAVTLALSLVAGFAVHFLGDALLPLLVVRLYRRLAGPGALEPAISAPGTLGAAPSHEVPGRARLVAVLGLLAAVLLAVHAASRAVAPKRTADVIAHRGASRAAPENTLAAFRRAIDDGATWIEIDVQENAEGEVIVAHDSDFMKQAGRALKVWEATSADLADLDIGSRFDPSFAAERVPTLREVLQLAKGRVGVVIELKYYGHEVDLEGRVAAVVEEAGAESEVMVMSLQREGLRRMAALRPDWTRGLLNTVSVGDLTRVDVDFLALNAAAATRAQVRRAHERGMKVYVWTINDPLQMSVMLSRGVDGIITDEPALARGALEVREGLGPFGQLVIWMASEVGLLEEPDVSVDAADA